MRAQLWTLAAVLLLALVGSAAAQGPDHLDNLLASEFPDLVQHRSDQFLTLADLGESLNPEQSFAELESAAHESTDTSLLQLHAAPKKTAPAASASTPWHRDVSKQPVARSAGEIECLDGDCTRAVKVNKAAVGSHPNADTKAPPSKLDIALSAVKEEIMVRAKELHLEKEWSKKVSVLIEEYQTKLAKVSNNIVNLRSQTKALLRKKKQIQNVQIQNKLRYKLQLAQADLNRLQKQMEHIAGKENEFADTERQLKDTMHQLKNSLLKLRGQEPKKLEAEGLDL